MKVVWTAVAQSDLDDILGYAALNFPSVGGPLETRVRAVVSRVRRWPESAREVEDRPGVRVVPLVRYPYRIFDRVKSGAIEILHIHHAKRYRLPAIE